MTDAASSAPASEMEAPLPRVLVVAQMCEGELDQWRQLGCDVIPNPHLSADTLATAVRDLDPIAIVTAGVAVCSAVMDAGQKLALIVHRGSGVGHVDVRAATARGIQVAHCPGVDAASIAEHAIGLLIACDRSIGVHEPARATASGLKGRSLGVVGFGAVGREVARRAIAFGMRVLAWNDPPIDESFSEMGIHPCEAMINVARLCDMVVVCIPDMDARSGLVNAKFVAAMRSGAVLVDTSRSGVVEIDALAERLRARTLVVGRDRFDTDQERLSFASLPGTLCTRNGSRDSAETSESYRGNALRVIGTFLRTGRAPNLLNGSAPSETSFVLQVRHANEPGVLSHTLSILGRAGINVEDVDNHGLHGARTGVATMHVSACVPESVIDEIRSDGRILGAVCLSPAARHGAHKRTGAHVKH